jgi:predicted RND superfamily exporter protein
LLLFFKKEDLARFRSRGAMMKMDTMLAPAPAQLSAFDPGGGSRLEQLIFSNRQIILAICAALTLLFGASATRLHMNASFEATIPTHHPFIANYLANQDNLHGLGNTLDIVVQANHGSILDPAYLTTLRELNDKVFLLPGVDRAYMQSLWMTSVTWYAVTAQGLDGGPVMPMSFDGSPAAVGQLQANLGRSNQIGNLIAPDFRSSIIKVPLLERDGAGKALDYGALGAAIRALQAEYDTRGVTVRPVGFSMVIGDLINDLHQILIFFVVSIAISAVIVYWFTRCARSTVLVVSCSLVAVLWQLGLLPVLGFDLDPYSILVPFLIFAIGISHGAQKMNGVMQDIGRGSPSLIAARLTFRRLFLAGFTALVCDAVGFAVLLLINIQAIQELAIIASLGVFILIFTNLIMLPLLLSFVGVNKTAALRSLRGEQAEQKHPLWAFLDLFTQRRYAACAIAVACVLAVFGLGVSQHLQVGDIHPGAPEFRASSAYNQDDAYFVNHYPTSSDVFIAMVKTPPGDCADYHVLAALDQLEQTLRRLPGVESTYSLSDLARSVSLGMNEGNWAWYDLLPNQPALNEAVPLAPPTLATEACNFQTFTIFLRDHKAATLASVADTITNFNDTTHVANMQILMAAGNGGIAAATNLVVKQASRTMLLWVYAAVIALSMITFRSWRAVLAAILPLVLTSILAQALMVWLGIGVKVATLPVTALGVGIGVDYALYILSIMMSHLRRGVPLSEAYFRALVFTGKVVMLTGCTLAVAVGTWAFSPIKFQADMGILLAFMFLVNMLGAAILLPSLATFLIKPARV